jgi:mannose-6-phosphate isomerase-like protein (cupin superfamily)
MSSSKKGATTMDVRVLTPFKEGDSEQIWLGLDTPGMVRKVFRTISKEHVNSEYFCAGVTIFEPGEASSYHNHPDSEEIDIVLSGSGLARNGEETAPIKAMDFCFIPKGVYHQHINTGQEPLLLVWIYTPQAPLPTM